MYKNFFRCLSLVLCCGLLFFSIAKPLTAKANVAQATIDIGYTLQDVFAVDPALVPFALTLLAAGYVFSNTDELIDKAQELSQQVRPTTEIWAKKFAENIEAGVETTWKLTSAVVADVNSIFNNFWNDDENIPLDVTHIISPACLTELSSLTYSDLLLSDMVGILSESATTTNRISSTLTSIKTSIVSLPITLVDSMQSLGATFTAEFAQFKTWYSNINSNLKAEVHQIPTWLSSINTNMKNEFFQVKDWLSNINTNLKNELLGVKTILVQIKDSVISNVVSSVDSLKAEIVSLPITITDSISAVFFPNGNNNLQDDDLDYTIGFAFNNYFPFFGSMKDYLAEYAVGFTCAGLVFNEFADIPFFHTLLLTSVSIGVVGSLLALGLNAVQSDKSAQKNYKASGKGG